MANFVDPESWALGQNQSRGGSSPQMGDHETFLGEPEVFFSFGCHPKKAHLWNESMKQRMCQLLELEQCIGVGETGLDYSQGSKVDAATQIAAFKDQIGLAVRFGKTLTIHCREAEADCFQTLYQALGPQSNLPIYFHCFHENWCVAQKWLSAFPNIKFGVNPNVTSNANRQFVAKIALNRIVVETDSPYMVPAFLTGALALSNPGLVPLVAIEFHQRRRRWEQSETISLQAFFQLLRENTRELFGI